MEITTDGTYFILLMQELAEIVVGEGNGTPLQYSCLENPMDKGPGRLQSMGSLGVGHNWATSLSLFTFMHWRRKWQPTPVFLPGESRDGGAWWAAVCGVAQSWTWLKLSSSGWKALNQYRLHSKYCVEGKRWVIRLVNGCGSRILDSSALCFLPF